MHSLSFPPFSELLADVIGGHDIDRDTMCWATRELIAGRWTESQTAAFLIALTMKGETPVEIAAAASVMREHMIPLETGRSDILDTCGTGGDGNKTFNISTAVAIVVAATGVPVVKHGNRAVSSRSGSADVLNVLGVKVECEAKQARRCLDGVGLAFCFAPLFHPSLQHVASVRRLLGVRTIFNCLGPLANPSRANFQLLGVGQPKLLDPLAGALLHLGTRRSILVSSHDGLDEVSLSAPTRVRQVENGSISSYEWTPSDFGMDRVSLSDLQADGAEQSAARIRSVLDGEVSPASSIVQANVAAALLAANRVQNVEEGVELALAAIQSGRARQVLEQLIVISNEKVN